jgi:hypothetical protein
VAEVARRELGADTVPLGMVEGIERLCPELQAAIVSLAEDETLK